MVYTQILLMMEKLCDRCGGQGINILNYITQIMCTMANTVKVKIKQTEKKSLAETFWVINSTYRLVCDEMIENERNVYDAELFFLDFIFPTYF